MEKTQLRRANGFSRVALLIGVAWSLLCSSYALAEKTLVLGVYSYQSTETVKAQYQGFSDYLSENIDGASVQLEVMGATELRLAVRNGEIDLIFPNPSLYEIIRNESEIGGVLATVEMLRNEQASSMLGGVMFSLSDRDDLINIHNLEGKMIAIPTLNNTGAYRVPLYEMVQSGVNRDALRFVQTGNNDSVVRAVLDGKADVGFVRTGILENWIVKGRLDPGQVKIINAKQAPDFPYFLSTELFPEWPFLVSSHVDHDIVRQIIVALFSLDKEHPAAKQARIAGFVPPVDYLPLERLFRKLRLFPYDQVPEFSLEEAIQKHSFVFGVSAFVFVLVVIAFIVSLLMRKSLKDKTNRLAEQKEKFQRLVNDLGQNYVVFSHSGEAGKLSYVSETIEDVFGMAAEEAVGKSWAMVVDWDDVSYELASEKLKRLIDGVEDDNQFDMSFMHPTQGKRTIRVSQRAVRDKNGDLLSIDGLVVNITAEIVAERKLEEAASVFEYAQEGILIANPEGHIVNVNAAFTEITGYSKEEVIGKNPSILSSGRQDSAFYKKMWATLLKHGNWHGEIWNRRKDGEVYPQKINMTVVRSDEGQVEQFIALFSDISVQKLQQAELEFIAHFDPLTKLPNRTLLTDRLGQAVAQTERHQHLLSAAFIDLDGFKEVNDVYGHPAGDFLLEEIALRFSQAIRKEDTIARIGGDEFVAVFVELDSPSALIPVLKRLLEDAGRPVVYEGYELSVSASIGVATYDGQTAGMSADLLIRQADQAMYHAKLAGKNQFAYFEDVDKAELLNAAEQKKKLEEIEAAMQAGEFELYYQPKLNVKTGNLLAFEALARWQHPEKGLLGPFKFLPVLEGQPLGRRFGYWVIESALEHVRLWQKAGKDFGVSVNIDGYLLEQKDFLDQLGRVLNRFSDVNPNKLTLELLESSALDDMDQVTRVIEQIRSFGIRMAIDDFGSGYASLSYLKQLPVNELKIDQSFIKDIFEKPQGLAILEGVISMSHAFDVLIVAEGVETEEHIDLLLKLGVEFMQGYEISRPMEVGKVLEWVESYRTKPDWKTVEVLDRDSIVMLMAVLEHRAWTRTVIESVEDVKSSGIELSSPYSCGFGRWLYSHGKSHLSKQRFYELELVHNEIHQVGGMVMQLKHQGQQDEALAELDRFIELKERLLELLNLKIGVR